MSSSKHSLKLSFRFFTVIIELKYICLFLSEIRAAEWIDFTTFVYLSCFDSYKHQYTGIMVRSLLRFHAQSVQRTMKCWLGKVPESQVV